MTTFTIHTVESAPAEVKEVLETVEKDNNGYIPNLIGLLANAPTALEAYRTVGAINRRSSCNGSRTQTRFVREHTSRYTILNSHSNASTGKSTDRSNWTKSRCQD